MIKKAVNPQCIIPVEQRLQHSGMFIPCTAHLRKSFCLDNALSINMCPTDSIQHIIQFVMGRTIQPEFSHGKVHHLVMQQPIAHHRGSYTFCRELTIIFFSTIRQYFIKDINNKLGYSSTNIPQNLFTPFYTFHRNTRQ